MNQLLLANLKNICKKPLPDLSKKLEKYTIKRTKDEQPLSPFTLIHLSMPTPPWFYCSSSGDIHSPFEPIFPLYAMAQSIRSVLIGTHFLAPVESSSAEWGESAAILLCYTSAFHYAAGFLSLNGRVLITPVKGPPVVSDNETTYSNLPKNPKSILAKLTKNNIWKFEPRILSHKSLWDELAQLFTESKVEIPNYFSEIFDYFLSYGPDKIELDERKTIQEGISAIASTRHEALYSGFGYDNFAFDAATNRESFGTGMDLKKRRFLRFAEELLRDVIGEIVMVIRSCLDKANKEVLFELTKMIFWPAFEFPSRITQPEDIRNNIRFVNQWVSNWLVLMAKKS